MKTIVLALTTLAFSSAFAFDCKQNEAQFIGKVTDLRVERIDQGIRDCYFKIQFTRFDQSMVCPLDEGKASSVELLDYDCRMGLENGQEISGYLVEKDGYIYIE